MFCPSCGTEYSIELNYCNRCGANLSVALTAEPQFVSVNLTKPTLIIGLTTALVTLGGFGMVIAGAAELARNVQLGSDPVIATIVMGMLTILTTDVLLVKQLSKLISASLSGGKLQATKRPIAQMPPAEFPLQRPANARLEPAVSVTENTTRFLEPEYRTPAEIERGKTAENLKS